MVPLPSLATVDGKPLTDLLSADKIAQVVQDTVQGGAAVVNLLQTGSAFYAPASSIARMVTAILSDSGEVLSTCALLEGEYGVDGVYMCAPAHLGKDGVGAIEVYDLSEDELAQMHKSAEAVESQLATL
jgi:malate dehydrogenase